MKKITYTILLLVVFGLGIWLTTLFYSKKAQESTHSESVILLEKVKNVCKLVTVEGDFNELYDETNIKLLTLYVPFPTSWSFPKKALVSVHGKVLVGYDMENVKIEADSTSRTITIRNLPRQAEILAIDHELQYKNLDESFFNTFSADDYTKINKNAKEAIRKQIADGPLIKKAETQGNQMLDVIRFMVESAGWKLEYGDAFMIPEEEVDEPAFPDGAKKD